MPTDLIVRPRHRRRASARAIIAGAVLVATSILGTPATVDAAVPAGPFTVDLTNRENVRRLFFGVHQASEGIPANWTGSVAGCVPGTVSPEFLEATRTRINYFRAMAGVSSDIPFTDANNAMAQQTALIMSARGELSHDPPNSWPCWTQAGRDGAAASNLSLGNTGPPAIDALMHDGSEVGHRRTMLNPRMQSMGSGSVTTSAGGAAAEAQLMVIDPTDAAHPQRDPWVAWPPAGFVPYQTVYPLWNFSMANADFANATVTMTLDGVTVPSRITTRVDFAGPGIVWGVDGREVANGPWPKPNKDDSYVVTVGNVMVGGEARSFTYTVTVFDPFVGDPARTPLVITGPESVAVDTPNQFTANPIPNATGYQWRTTKVTPFALTDGAENGLANFTAVTGGYDPIDPTTRATGDRAFRLSLHAGFGEQSLTLPQTLLPNADSTVSFSSRLIFAQSAAARLEASTDGGATWVPLYDQVGANEQETTFTPRQVSLAAFAGQPTQLRFRLAYLGGTVFTCCDPIGWYVDDVTFSGFQALAPPVLSAVSATPTFAFSPTEAALFDVDVRPEFFGSGFGDWSAKRRTSSLPPVVVTQPQGATVGVGDTATFTVTATGAGPLTFAWARDGQPLVDGAGVTGAATPTLTLTNVQVAQAGNYSVRVGNAAGSVLSGAAVLTVAAPAAGGLAVALDNDALDWATSGDATWSAQAGISHDGVDAATSGRLADLQSSRLSTTVAGPATLSFWWRVDSEANFDFLSVSLDGVLQTRISGPTGWAQATVTVPAGAHTVVWTYAKDGSVTAGADAGWVDQVEVLAEQAAPSLADAVDAPAQAWTTAGDRPWGGQRATTRDGTDAAQSGTLLDSQSSRLQTTVTGPATLTFQWKVTSELNFDFLSVAIDGVLQARISGPVDWEARTLTIPGGVHEVTWTYAKDGSVTVGVDAGWVDQVTVT